MTDQEFIVAARSVALGLSAACVGRKLSREDSAALIGAALTEALAQALGPVGAVERMRDLADTVERQLLDELN